jgi:hypothetical protein
VWVPSLEPWRKLGDLIDWLAFAGFSEGPAGIIGVLVLGAWIRLQRDPAGALRILSFGWGFVCLTTALSVTQGDYFTHIADEERLALGMSGFVTLAPVFLALTAPIPFVMGLGRVREFLRTNGFLVSPLIVSTLSLTGLFLILQSGLPNSAWVWWYWWSPWF